MKHIIGIKSISIASPYFLAEGEIGSLGAPFEPGKVFHAPQDAEIGKISWDDEGKPFYGTGHCEVMDLDASIIKAFRKWFKIDYKQIRVVVRNKAFARPVIYNLWIPKEYSEAKTRSLKRYIQLLTGHRRQLLNIPLAPCFPDCLIQP